MSRRITAGTAALLAVVGGLAVAPADAATPCGDVALVFAIDASASIDDREYALQTGGIASALADPQVADAVARAGDVRLAAVVWGDEAFPLTVIDWQAVPTPADLDRFAVALLAADRRADGSTRIGYGLAAAIDLFAEPAGCAARQVIDVSGDGRETRVVRGARFGLAGQRARAEALGITINGLAVASREPDLPAYYGQYVAAGAGAFVIEVPDWQGFQEAMTRKLLREIGVVVADALAVPEGAEPVVR